MPKSRSGDDPLAHSRDLLNRHLDFLQRQCRRAVHRLAGGSAPGPGMDLENDSLELFNRVLDRIQRNDFAFIRHFDQRSRFTTYLTAMVARQAVDLVRQRRGRDRARERARALGKLGLLLFNKIISNGLAVPQALQELRKEENLPADLDAQLAGMADHILRGRGDPRPVVIPLDATLHAPDSAVASPEELALEEERRERISAAVACLRRNLSGSELLLLRLRFPPEPPDRPFTAEAIANLMGISRKAVYRRLDRLLPRCRMILHDAGINEEDLFPDGEGNWAPPVRPNTGSIVP